MLSKHKKLLMKIDLFSRDINLEDNDSQSYHTWIGVLLTFITIISCCVIGFLFGNEIYQRKNPKVVATEERIDTSRISFKDLPISFAFIYTDGSNIEDIDQVLKFHAGIMDYNTMKLELDFNVLRKCDPEYYNKEVKHMVEEMLETGKEKNQTYFCLMPEKINHIQDNYGSLNATFTTVAFYKCNPETDVCKADNEEKVYQEFYVTMQYPAFLVNPNNYTDPISYYMTSHMQQLNSQFLKRNYFRFTINNLETNQGWLLDDHVDKNYLHLDSIKNDINPGFAGFMYWATFESPNLRKKTTREYMKIQDLFAKIGGFFNCLVIIFKILTIHYVKFRYYKEI